MAMLSKPDPSAANPTSWRGSPGPREKSLPCSNPCPLFWRPRSLPSYAFGLNPTSDACPGAGLHTLRISLTRRLTERRAASGPLPWRSTRIPGCWVARLPPRRPRCTKSPTNTARWTFGRAAKPWLRRVGSPSEEGVESSWQITALPYRCFSVLSSIPRRSSGEFVLLRDDSGLPSKPLTTYWERLPPGRAPSIPAVGPAS